MYATVRACTYNCCCLKWRDEAMKVPADEAIGAGVTCSHLFKSNNFLFPFVVGMFFFYVTMIFLLKLSAVVLSNDIIAEFAFKPPTCDKLVTPETVVRFPDTVTEPDTG